MAAEGALHRLVQTDFHHSCRTAFFCFQCAAPMCAHCCSSPMNHRQLHHGGNNNNGPAPAMVDSVRFAPAVRSMDAIGCGYSTAGIQRFRKNGEKWIPILRQQQQDQRFHKPCTHCEQFMDSSSSYCSFACRAEDRQGNGFAMVQELVEFAQQFNEPIVQLDSFCTICFKAYSSSSCPAHQLHHNGPQVLAEAAAQGDTVITVRFLDGWAAVDEAQLPAHFVEHVQALQWENGPRYYPVHRRNIPAIPDDDEAHPCQRQHCPESFPGDAIFCSLRCRHLA